MRADERRSGRTGLHREKYFIDPGFLAQVLPFDMTTVTVISPSYVPGRCVMVGLAVPPRNTLA
jgi:hypothetical protein